MIRSMTGFAAISREREGNRVHVTVKSVNHRFLDVQIKAPQTLAAIENRLRLLVQQRLVRGRVELSVQCDRTVAPPREAVLDEALLARVAALLDGARERGLIEGRLTASDVLRLPQVLEVRAAPDVTGGVPEALAAHVEATVGDALDALRAMRETEGGFLKADLDARLDTVGALVEELERLGREGQERLAGRLRDRLAGLPADLAGEPSALAQEVVRFVARSDIDEEVVRLRGHVQHWRVLAAAEESCGRKLDFLLQEMHREINTIGSKAEGGRVAEAVIAAKAELERLREQVQNVE